MIIGEMNTKVGADNTNSDRAMGKHGCDVVNDNGERLVDFCLNNDCVIGCTTFPYKNIHKLIWRSPDGTTVNQIDHFIVNSKWRRSLQDVRTYRRADANSDYYLVAATIKLKLRRAVTQGQHRKQLDITKLKCPNINKEFVLELRNRFIVLCTTTKEEDHDVDSKWNTIKSTYCETAKHVVVYRRKKKKEWLTPGTWQKTEKRKQLKDTLLNTKSSRLQEQVHKAYMSKDKKIKRSARSDKRSYIEEVVDKAEQAATKGEMSVVYKMTKRICCNNINQSARVKDKNGKALTTECN